jgi:hypothetical protein
MQNLTSSSKIANALRAQICTICSSRPEGSERLNSRIPRSCQAKCTIFINLDKLIRICDRIDDQSLTPYERATQELVCDTCQRCPSAQPAGDYCSDRFGRTCPLSRYLGDVVSVIERFEEPL